MKSYLVNKNNNNNDNNNICILEVSGTYSVATDT